MHTLNITVSDLTLDTVVGLDNDGIPITLADAVVDEAARQLAQSSDYHGVQHRIREVKTEVIRELVSGEIVAALSEPIQKTTEWGDPVGPPTTLREQIAKAAQEAVKPSGRNDYQPTALEQFIRSEVDSALVKELRAAVEDEKAKVVAAIRAKAADLIAQAVKEGIGR